MKEILDDHLLKKEPGNYKNVKWIYLFLGLLVFGSGVSTALAWYEVETIIGSGPLMSIIGISVTVFSRNLQNKLSFILGWVPLAISIFWIFAINLFDLSPSDGEFIIPLSLSIASILIFVVALIVFIKIYNRRD